MILWWSHESPGRESNGKKGGGQTDREKEREGEHKEKEQEGLGATTMDAHERQETGSH